MSGWSSASDPPGAAFLTLHSGAALVSRGDALELDRRLSASAALPRFVNQMRAANRDLTVAGCIVLAPGEADEVITDAQKTALGTLHLRKIDLADRVLIVNPGGYIGESTSREIADARVTGKPISFTDPV